MNSEQGAEYPVASVCPARAWRVRCDAMPGMKAAMQHIYTTSHQHLNTMHHHRMPDA
jgi:hypothetical protein